MLRTKFLIMAAVAGAVVSAETVHANVLLNSFENSLGGFVYPSGGDTSFTISGYSQTTGVTDGSYSAIYSPSGTNTGTGPNYGQFIESAGYSTTLTTELQNATAITLQVFAPTNSFGGFIQFNAALQTDNTGYPYDEIGGFDLAHTPTFGTESTITFQFTAKAIADIAAAEAAGDGTQLSIAIGGGYSAGNETAYFDNLEAVTPAAVPEPASLALLALGAPALLARRRGA
jgi:hypothetical protein